jgi:hypothetical protein
MGSWKYESGQRELYAVKTPQVGILAANTDYAEFDPAAAYQFMDK